PGRLGERGEDQRRTARGRRSEHFADDAARQPAAEPPVRLRPARGQRLVDGLVGRGQGAPEAALAEQTFQTLDLGGGGHLYFRFLFAISGCHGEPPNATTKQGGSVFLKSRTRTLEAKPIRILGADVPDMN